MIRHLPFFAVVAQEQHFQRAAEKLSITQSALSRRIQLLEEELGVKLFERLARGIRLTPAGESFYGDVRKMQFDLEQAKTRARNISLGQIGQVTVAVAPSAVSHPLVAQMFKLFRAREPNIQINMKMIYSEEQIPALQAQDIDIGVMYRLSEEPWLTYTPIANDRMTLALPSEHPLAAKVPLSLKDLENVPLIWPTRSHSPRLYDRFLTAISSRGVSPRIEVEVHSTESVLSIVAMGMAAGFVPKTQAHLAPAGVIIRDFEDFAIELPLCMVWRATHSSPIVDHFAATLADVIQAACAK